MFTLIFVKALCHYYGGGDFLIIHQLIAVPSLVLNFIITVVNIYNMQMSV